MTTMRGSLILALLGGLLTSAPALAQDATFKADGIIESTDSESTDGGFRFPDGSLQETAAVDELYNLSCDDGQATIYDESSLQWICASPLQGPQGDQGLQGKLGAQGVQGKMGLPGEAGDNGANCWEAVDGGTEVADCIGPDGEQGEQGKIGPPGLDGADGNTVLSGDASPPDEAVGNDGDFYLNTATNTLFGPKTVGRWPDRGVSLLGPSGEQGEQGEQGKIGPQGNPGTDGADGNTVLSGNGPPGDQGSEGDFYIDTGSNTLYGPKVESSWSEGIALVGPQGEQGKIGPQGEQGKIGPQGPPGPVNVYIVSVTGSSGEAEAFCDETGDQILSCSGDCRANSAANQSLVTVSFVPVEGNPDSCEVACSVTVALSGVSLPVPAPEAFAVCARGASPL